MWKQGQKPPVLEFLGYPADRNLCVLKALDKYSLHISDWRKADNQTQLLLGQIKARKKVVSSTISGWVTAALKLADIDLDTFKVHSTRAASTSTANAIGLALGETLEKGSWSNASFWRRFYKKGVILTKVVNFEKSLFLTNKKSIANNSNALNIGRVSGLSKMECGFHNPAVDRTVIFLNYLRAQIAHKVIFYE